MSDDIPVIFADQLLAPEGHVPRAVFLSAATTSQMQQYAAGGWRVFTAPGFSAVGQVDLAAVPAQAGDENCAQGADIVSLEGSLWSDAARGCVVGCNAAVVKVNCAFQDLAHHRGEDIAAALAEAGYALLAAYWKTDNSYAFGSVSRLDHLAAFVPREWNHLNLIAVRDPARARAIRILGRLYVGEEQRIAELRLSNVIRADHIGRLENALMARQGP